MTTGYDVRRGLLRERLRDAVDDARERCASFAQNAPDRRFYLGVALAAADEVHPERAEARPEDWLDLEDLPFREGYLAMQARIAALVMADSELPGRLVLPEPT